MDTPETPTEATLETGNQLLRPVRHLLGSLQRNIEEVFINALDFYDRAANEPMIRMGLSRGSLDFKKFSKDIREQLDE